MLNQLNNLLKEKIKLYHELKSLLQEEKNVIGESKITLLQEFLSRKELIVKKLRDLEEKRKSLLIKNP